MPNWKKVIVSGSDAVLNSLNVTNGVTGSLFGTGSWAVRAQSASIADNAVTASRALQANTASYAVFAATATSATSAGSATSASYATFAATSTTSTNATNATSASYATFANTASSANDFIVRGSAAIGTTSVGAAKLEVVGNIRTSTYYNFNGNPSVPTDTTAAIFDQSGVGPTISGLNITFRAGSPTPSEIMRVSSGGSVGINNTNPTYKLDVSDAGSVLSSTVSTGSMKGIRIYNTTTATSNNAIGLWFATGPHQAGIASFRATADTTWETTLAFYTHVDATSNLNDATEKMRITGQGNVGIGTTIPVNKLTVAGNADFGASTSTYAGPAQYGALTFPRGQILWSNTNGQNQLYLASNAYNNASGVFAYRSGSKATAIGLDDGGMSFLTAGNGTANATISWTTAMVIANGGNIGIGTTLPNYRLTVGNSNGSAAVHIGGGNSNSIPAIAIQSDFSSWASSQNGFAYYYNATNGNLDLYRKDNSATENQVMTWTRASGNVGIGTTSPTSTLHVVGTGYFSSTITAISATGNNGAPSAGTFYSGDDSSAMWRGGVTIQHNSNVTISAGSSIGLVFTPLASTNSSFYGHASIKAVRPNATANNQDTDLAFWTRAGASNSTTDSEKMRITSGGNVGIGSTSPAYKLDVVNAGVNTIRVQNTSNTSDAYLIAQNTLGSTFFGINATGGYIYNGGALPILFYTNGSERVRILSDGNVGIGTTAPGAKLEVVYSGGYDDGISVKSTSGFAVLTMNAALDSYPILEFKENGTQKWQIFNRPTDDSINFYTFTSGADRLTILDNGNVGIGSSSPAQKLQIVDSTSFTSVNVYNSKGSSGGTSALMLGLNNGAFVTNDAARVEARVIDVSTAALDFKVYGGGLNTIMSLLGGGNVGIGTTNPTVKLDVISSGGSGMRIIDSTAPNFYINNTVVQWKRR